MFRWFQSITLAVVVTMLAITGSHCALAKGKPGGGGGGGGGTGDGTVYFDASGQGAAVFLTMNSDGSNKSLLPIDRGEPSRLLHGGCRWILSGEAIPGEFYPDGVQRHELFAIAEDGTGGVQLTNDPDVHPYGARWEPGDFAVSWIGRRFDSQTGQVIDGGVYEADLLYDGQGDVMGLAQQPLLPLLAADLVLDGSGATVPNLRSHDWSPDGTQFVHDRMSGQELRIFDVLIGQSRQLIQVNATLPVWSPDGAKIAFNGPLTTIASIAPDGTNFKTIIARGTNYTVGKPVWSPTGSHLVYWRFETRSFKQFIYRATADGVGNTNLTSELNYAIPYGWR